MGSVKKSDADAEAEGAPKAVESFLELKSLLGLKQLAREDDSGSWASPSKGMRCGLKLFCCGSGDGVPVRADGRGVEETTRHRRWWWRRWR